MHMKSRSHLREGDYVSKGDLIGYVGNTGNSYGAHLHILMIDNSQKWGSGDRSNNNVVNPQRFFEPRVTFRGNTSSLP